MNNREIKFRAQRIDNRRWVYGHYFMSPLTDENSGADPKDGFFFLCGPKRHCIEQNGVSFVIDVNTLGQFTGLKDKNNKEIYEGDIIEYKKIIGEVIYSGESISWLLKISNDSPYEFFTNQFKIIGNIFENPELINKQ